MKIDKKTIDMLTSLPDESLWRMICTIGSAHGFDLSKMNVNTKDMEKLRGALGQMTDSDVTRAMEIFGSCKKQDM